MSTEILRGRLWLGGKKDLARARNYDLIVIAAYEVEPHLAEGGGRIITIPLDDDEHIPEQEVDTVGRAVARAVRKEQKVLVTCQMGLNRSALVTAVACHYLGFPMDETIWMLRRMRGRQVLSNPYFVRFLRSRYR